MPNCALRPLGDLFRLDTWRKLARKWKARELPSGSGPASPWQVQSAHGQLQRFFEVFAASDSAPSLNSCRQISFFDE